MTRFGNVIILGARADCVGGCGVLFGEMVGKIMKQTLIFLVAVVVIVGLVVVWHRLFSPEKGPDVNSVNQYDGERDNDKNVFEGRAPELNLLFPNENDWERRANMVKAADASVYFLFAGNPEFSGNGDVVSINKCTVVYLPRKLPKGWETEYADQPEPEVAARADQAIIFEVKGQIILEFDRSLGDLYKLKQHEISLSLLEQGKLMGEVNIKGGNEYSAKGLKFYISTRNVVFNSHQLVTSSSVDFRIGKHSGVGEKLTIDFKTPDTFSRRTKVPQADRERASLEGIEDQRERDLLERERIMSLVDESVENGNLGNGFSITQVEFEKLSKEMVFDLASLNFQNNSSETERFDTLHVGCGGSVHFEQIPGRAGEWCVRFDGKVSASGVRNSKSACSFKGESVYLYFKDHQYDEFEQSQIPGVASEIQKRSPAGELARLKTSMIRVKGEGSSNPLNVWFKFPQKDPNVAPREINVTAVQAYYDDVDGVFSLTDQLEENATGDVRRPPVAFEMIDYDKEGNAIRSRMTSSRLRVEFDRENLELNCISAHESGSLTTSVTTGGREQKSLQAYWSDGLRLAPVDSSEGDVFLLTSTGSVRCSLESFGNFSASEANFWFRRIGKSAVQSDVQERRATFAPDERLSQSDESSVASSNEGRSNSFDFGFVPICAKFANDVRLNTEYGEMNVKDYVTVRFSDQTATNVPALLNLDKTKGAFQNRSEGADDGVGATAGQATKNDEKFNLACKRLEVLCELVPKEVMRETGNGAFHVSRLDLFGDAFFKQTDAQNREKATLTADAVTVEEPLTVAMKLLFSSRKGGIARFKADELELLGEKIMISYPDNSFEVLGPGDVTIYPPPRSSENVSAGSDVVSAAAFSDPVSISWSKSMKFNGQTMIFLASDDADVVVSSSDSHILCGSASLVLKEPVDVRALEKGKIVSPAVDYVECRAQGLNKPAQLKFNARNTGAGKDVSNYSGFYETKCQLVRFNVETGAFSVENQGEFVATVLSQTGVSELGAGVIDVSKSLNPSPGESTLTPAAADQPHWICVDARFNGAEGSIKTGFAQIKGGVSAVVSDVAGPNRRVTLDDSSTWAEGAITFHCREAFYRGAGSGEGMKRDAEIDAQGDVSFRVGEFSGYCEKLGYAAAKNLVTLSGSENGKAYIESQKFSGDTRRKVGEFMEGRVHLDTRKVEFEGVVVDLNEEALKTIGRKE